MATATQDRSGFRGDVQGMRAVAVGSVIAAHIATYQLTSGLRVRGGFIGVDVFFVLSGYLITRLMLRESEATGRVSLGGFYARRARRILPAATVVLVVAVAYAAWRLPDVERIQYDHDATWSVIFLANWHFARAGVNYFDTSTLSPLQHFWSLAVEEQFYLVWPLLLALLARRVRRTWLGLLLLLICLASLAWAIFTTSHHGPTSAHEAYFSSVARVYELGIGALVAVTRPRIASTRWRTVVGAAGLAAIVAAVVLLGADAPFPGWEALIPCLATAALIVAGDGGPTPVTRLLSIPPLRFLGNISYSAYLWHFLVIVLAPTLFPSDWRLRVLIPVELAVILGLSIASYRLIEQPFLQRRVPLLSKGRRTLVLWPVAVALVLGAVTAGNAYAATKRTHREEAAAAWYQQHPQATEAADPTSAPGAARRKPTAVITAELKRALKLTSSGAPFPPGLDLHQMDRPQPGGGYMCFAVDGQAKLGGQCVYGDHRASYTVALIGDSHAGMISPALDAMGVRDHFRVVMYQKLTCAPYYVQQRTGSLAGECSQFRDWTWGQLRALRPDAVVLYGRGYLDVEPPAGQSVASAWRTGEVAAVRRFESLGAKVVMMGDVPDRGQQPPACIEAHSLESSCVVRPVSAESQSNTVTAAVAAQEHAGYVPMQQFVCAGGSCPLVAGSRILYWDDSHLTRVWINHITPAIEQRLAPLLGPTS